MILDEEKKRGQKFEWWIHTRSDLHWLADHPPLTLLGPEVIWIPRGQDYGGMNDRHAVVPRRHIHKYFGLWQGMQDGNFMNFLANLTNACSGTTDINSEGLLLAHLLFTGLGAC